MLSRKSPAFAPLIAERRKDVEQRAKLAVLEARYKRMEKLVGKVPFFILTQNRIGVGRAGRKQWKILRVNSGKKGKSEPKRLRFYFVTTYGPEGRGFESLTAYQNSSKSSDFEEFCFS